MLWAGDEAPRFPDDGAPPPPTTYFPPVGGFRFGIFTLPPHGETAPGPDVDIAAALDELNTALPGMLDYMEPSDPGMHTTDTIDFEVVLSGEVTLELDDGATVHLQAGRHRRAERHPPPLVEPGRLSRPRSPSSSAAPTTSG